MSTFKTPKTVSGNRRVSDEAVREKQSEVAVLANAVSVDRVSRRLMQLRGSDSTQEEGNNDDGGDHPLVPGLKNWSNGNQRRINLERFRIASRETRLEEVKQEAAIAHPEAFPDPPPQIVIKPSMMNLIENGLLGDNAWQHLGMPELVALGQSLESDPQQKIKFSAAMTQYTCSMSPAEFGGSEFKSVVDEIKRVQTNPYDAEVSARKWTQVWQYAHYERLRKDWEAGYALKKQAVEDERKQFILDAMTKWNNDWGYNLEKALWGGSPLFAYCASNPLMAERLPYMPWTHTEKEAEDVLTKITSLRTPRQAITAETMYLKLCVAASGKLAR
jgi:hypothetical protein